MSVLRLNKKSGPERHIVPIAGGGLGWVGYLYLFGLYRGCDDLGDCRHLVVGQFKSLSQALIRHFLIHHIAQETVLIAGANAVISVHFLDARITSDRVVIRSLDFECARESLFSICIQLLVLYSNHSQ